MTLEKQQQEQSSLINKLLIYTNQIDPLVPSNPSNLEVWTHSLWTTNIKAAHRVVLEHYANREPHDRDPITPGYIKRKARALEKRAYGPAVMCQAHDWNHRDTCTECKSEISARKRHPSQRGQEIREFVPPPLSVKQQLKNFLKNKSI